MTRFLAALQRIEDGPAGPVLEFLTIVAIFVLGLWVLPLIAVGMGVVP